MSAENIMHARLCFKVWFQVRCAWGARRIAGYMLQTVCVLLHNMQLMLSAVTWGSVSCFGSACLGELLLVSLQLLLLFLQFLLPLLSLFGFVLLILQLLLQRGHQRLLLPLLLLCCAELVLHFLQLLVCLFHSCMCCVQLYLQLSSSNTAACCCLLQLVLLVCLTPFDAGLTLFCAGFERLVLSVSFSEGSLTGVGWGGHVGHGHTPWGSGGAGTHMESL